MKEQCWKWGDYQVECWSQPACQPVLRLLRWGRWGGGGEILQPASPSAIDPRRGGGAERGGGALYWWCWGWLSGLLSFTSTTYPAPAGGGGGCGRPRWGQGAPPRYEGEICTPWWLAANWWWLAANWWWLAANCMVVSSELMVVSLILLSILPIKVWFAKNHNKNLMLGLP